VARTKAEIADEAFRVVLIELIETVFINKLPRSGREEIRTMVQIHDLRHTRVYQEGLEDGEKIGEKVGIVKGVRIAIAKMVAEKKSAEDIAAMLGLDEDLVRRAMADKDLN
jgi:predicted transposase YdaD